MIQHDKIIEWVDEAYAYAEKKLGAGEMISTVDWCAYFANLVAQHQKEQDALACKRVADNPSSLWQEAGCWKHAAENCESAIRSQE